MQANREPGEFHPLRNLTEEQFMALGGNAVVYVKHVKGDAITSLTPNTDIVEEEDYHIVVSADGQPLMVADTTEAVSDWLADRNFGVVTLH
jgi:hypothetical protein